MHIIDSRAPHSKLLIAHLAQVAASARSCPRSVEERRWEQSYLTAKTPRCRFQQGHPNNVGITILALTIFWFFVCNSCPKHVDPNIPKQFCILYEFSWFSTMPICARKESVANIAFHFPQFTGRICEDRNPSAKEGGRGQDEVLGGLGKWGQDAGCPQTQRVGYSKHWSGHSITHYIPQHKKNMVPQNLIVKLKWGHESKPSLPTAHSAKVKGSRRNQTALRSCMY